MRTSGNIDAISDALVKANLLLVNPTKDKTAKVKTKTGADYSYDYVALDSILSDVRPVLQAHGLALLQEATAGQGYGAVTTRIIHSSGQWIEFDALTLPGNDAQSIGSAITYARRYGVLSALCLAAGDDDDGAAATKASRSAGGAQATRGRGASLGHDTAPPPASTSPASSESKAKRSSQTAPAAGDSSSGGGGLTQGEGAAAPPPESCKHEHTVGNLPSGRDLQEGHMWCADCNTVQKGAASA